MRTDPGVRVLCKKLFESDSCIDTVMILNRNGDLLAYDGKALTQRILDRPTVTERIVIGWGLFSSILENELRSFTLEIRNLTLLCVPTESDLVVAVIPSLDLRNGVVAKMLSVLHPSKSHFFM